MKKFKLPIILITLVILAIICGVIYFNLTYKTRDEKWNEEVSNLGSITKKSDDNSFLMSIIYKNDVSEDGITLEGKVLRGTVNVGDTISLIGVADTKEVKVEKILNDSNEEVESATKDDRINVLISGISDKSIKPGQVLAKKDSIEAHKEFIAEIYILSKDEGGVDISFKKDDFLDFYIRTSSFVGKVEKIKESSTVKPGSSATIKVKLNTTVAIEEGTTFVIRKDSQTMGAGEITKVIK